jgi:mono/diheme cytochrome c family protein
MLCRSAAALPTISAALVLAGFFVAPRASAQTGGRPVVAGYERFFAHASGDAVAGELLIGELNCLSCHEAEAAIKSRILSKQAPILDHVGLRVRPKFLREYLADPQKTKPGTTMPNLFTDVSTAERDEQIEALTHFLASTDTLAEGGPVTPAIRRGEQLFHTVGCVACHNPRRDGSAKLPTSVPLPDMESKYSLPGLTEFLKNPLAIRPSGRMPHMNLDDTQAREIASYLLRNLEVESKLEYAYYEGNWDKLPDFDSLTPTSYGVSASFDVNVGRENSFAIVFKGRFRVEQEGNYIFHIGSDDGSRLKVDGHDVVTVDGVHPFSSDKGKIALQPGIHEVEVQYFEGGGEQELKVEFQGKGIDLRALEYALIGSEDEEKAKNRFQVDPVLVAKGKQLFSAIGCASCHQLRVDGKQLASERKAKPFSALSADGGCLTGSGTGVPRFQLNDAQRSSVAAAINLLNSETVLPARTPEEVITSTLITFNCVACHQRGELGGVESGRNALFQSDQPEMGDEGRIPPHLTGVGSKLQPDWLKHIFDKGAKDRPYMFTRMPRFGSQNVGHLIAAFGDADPDVASHGSVTDIDERHLKAAGRKLVGAEGFSCIKCHTWGNEKATGIQSINMVTMTHRLKENWFHEYLLNPQQYRPGTRMPAAWPQGQVLLPTLLDGKALTQIHSVWDFLSDGDKAVAPVGLGSNPIVLMAFDEAIIYRNFIEGAGPRAIGVGYSEKANQAFDANDLRIALLWHGAFIDASKHWIGRGSGFQPPLGDNILKLPLGVSFAILSGSDASWPTETAKELGYEFRGYRLGKARRPTFMYDVSGVRVEDTLVPDSKEPFTSVTRTLRLSATSPVGNFWYRAAVGNSIEQTEDGWYVVDGSWRIRLDAESTIRKSAGQVELLVPVHVTNAGTAIAQQYAW